MNKTALILALLAGAGTLTAPTIAQTTTPTAPATRTDLPSSTAILEKSMKEYGGIDKIRALKDINVFMTANIMGMDVTMRSAWRRSGGRKSIMTMGPQGSQEKGTDGKVWWEKGPFGYALVTDEDARRSSDGQAEMFIAFLDPITMAKEKNSVVKTIAKETFEERECYVLEIVTDDETSHAFYDVATSMLLGMKTMDGDRTTKILFKDWKEVEGIKVFHTFEVNDPGMPMGPIVFKAMDMRFNSLNDDFFALPDEVKKLAESAPSDDKPSEGITLTDGQRPHAELLLRGIRGSNPTVDQLKDTVKAMEQAINYLPPDQKTVHGYVVQELKKDIKAKGG